MQNKNQDFLLQTSLDAAVPLWIEAFKEYSFEDLQRVLKESEEIFAISGEALLYPIKDKTQAMFNATAKAIAALSFVPGGITTFNRHWETKKEALK